VWAGIIQTVEGQKSDLSQEEEMPPEVSVRPQLQHQLSLGLQAAEFGHANPTGTRQFLKYFSL
jgi:hypothetical protein